MVVAKVVAIDHESTREMALGYGLVALLTYRGDPDARDDGPGIEAKNGPALKASGVDPQNLRNGR
jgi:hypothetical protein